MITGSPDLTRLAIHTMTTRPWSLSQCIEGFSRVDVRAISVWRNVLEGPLKALTWLVNDLRRRGQMLYRHQFVTTGTCVTPVPIAPGDALVADFSEFGQARVVFSSN